MKLYFGNFRHESSDREEFIHVDPWDGYEAACTLAKVISPVLQSLLDQAQGAPYIELEDVPERLRDDKDPWAEGSLYFERWEWVLREMIICFDYIAEDEELDENYERIQNGLRLFGKYYLSLWD
jgi:hypothetical protein